MPFIRACRLGSVLVVALGTLSLGTLASAQSNWPDRTILAVVPFAAGAANDIVGRIVFEQVSKQVNQPIVFENRPGAGGTLGANLVAKAAPNGHTVLVHSSSFASARIGSTSHLAAERFRLSAGIEAQHIPFRGPNEAFTEVLAGRIDFYFLPLAPALPLVKEGQLTALAVSSEKRATTLPDVPTTTELGLKDSTYLFWTAVFLPAKTPRDIVNKLHEESRKALLVPAVQERIARTGNEPMPMTVEEFGAYFRQDVLSTTKLMQQIGIKPQE